MRKWKERVENFAETPFETFDAYRHVAICVCVCVCVRERERERERERNGRKLRKNPFDRKNRSTMKREWLERPSPIVLSIFVPNWSTAVETLPI